MNSVRLSWLVRRRVAFPAPPGSTGREAVAPGDVISGQRVAVVPGREYDATIQSADIDGDGQAELLARSAGGIVVSKCDNATHRGDSTYW
jgi:hypothetical protein